MSAFYRWVQKVWYDDAAFGWILLPFAGLYRLLSVIRLQLYRRGILRTGKASVPVIVVGNITAGGTGKTPTVIWLVRELRAKGFVPGIVSRGYGGSRSGTSMRVDADSDAAVVGDEPVLLARRGKCPVAVDSDRLRAADMLIDDGANLIVADDGLQHLRLHRDFEICVIDGVRGLGNRRLLPAGPLREPAQRLARVDQVLVNGGDADEDAVRFDLRAGDARRLNETLTRPLQSFRGSTVHAVAGIGNPQRFFDLLRVAGIQVIEHAFPDHAVLTEAELQFSDDFDVFMTEKDAVKLDRLSSDKYWFVPVDLIMDTQKATALIEQLVVLLQGCGDSQ